MKIRPRVLVGILVTAALVAVILFVTRTRPRDGAQAATRDAPGPPPVPVVAATATQGDLGVYLTGLGAVTPVYTVTIHARQGTERR